ncbi:hypothetical protein XENTR_v10024726 [Xenopus tropicalis]|nr:hypothetical protein XENTR_v10024726 [Xenopus tropicalis]
MKIYKCKFHRLCINTTRHTQQPTQRCIQGQLCVTEINTYMQYTKKKQQQGIKPATLATAFPFRAVKFLSDQTFLFFIKFRGRISVLFYLRPKCAIISRYHIYHVMY